MNVNKGSRQIKPVTLGKRLALIVGHQVLPGSVEYQMVLVVNLFTNGLGKAGLVTFY